MSFEMAYNQNYRKEKKTLQQHFLTFVQKKKKNQNQEIDNSGYFFLSPLCPHHCQLWSDHQRILLKSLSHFFLINR